jgi:hypothetical protein
MRRNRLVVRLCGAALLAMVAGGTGIASAQVNCEAIPAGPARTDCYIGLRRCCAAAERRRDLPQRDRQAPRNKAASRGARAVGVRGLDHQLASLSGSQRRIPHPRPSRMQIGGSHSNARLPTQQGYPSYHRPSPGVPAGPHLPRMGQSQAPASSCGRGRCEAITTS